VVEQEPSLQGQCSAAVLSLRAARGLRMQGICLLGSWICRLRAMRCHDAHVTVQGLAGHPHCTDGPPGSFLPRCLTRSHGRSHRGHAMASDCHQRQRAVTVLWGGLNGQWLLYA
jgi:hypothetical protein